MTTGETRWRRRRPEAAGSAKGNAVEGETAETRSGGEEGGVGDYYSKKGETKKDLKTEMEKPHSGGKEARNQGRGSSQTHKLGKP